ncbi:MAG TPA: redoxin domain-containing protein [Candidatus Acidoferrum sp.]|nr:redoxin domain-containing protein [Candidatus Acidoferrum sp.]
MRRVSRRFSILFLARAIVATMLACQFSVYLLLARQTVIDIHGSPDEVLAQDRGKVLVFVFVRTDCPISNRYAPLLQQMNKKYGQQATFRLVFPDRNESTDKVRRYLQDYNYQLTAIRDLDHALVKKTMAKTTPEAAVFDAKGALVYHGRIDNLYEHIGQSRRAATTHELADAIEAASKGLHPPVSTTEAVGCFISDLE